MSTQIDTNAIIDYLAGNLPPLAEDKIDKLLFDKQAQISIIVKIELLSAKKYSYDISSKDRLELRALETFIRKCELLPLSESIAKRTYLLKRKSKKKIKLPDAIIAATSLEKGTQLLTHNVSDFSLIEELTIIDPYHL